MIGIMRKRGIVFKATRVICLATMIVAGAGLSVGYILGFKLLRNTIGQSYVTIVSLLANSVNRIIAEEINDVMVTSASPLWLGYVEESNSKYGNMGPEESKRLFLDKDRKWEDASVDNPLVKGILKNPLSERLKSLVEDDEVIVEIFITDEKGALVASSGKTSDFYQADEEWWQRAFNDGLGEIYLGKIEFDQSADMWVMPIAVPIRNESGRVVGICKCMEGIKRFLGHLEDFTIGRYGYAVLVNKDGLILVHRGTEPFSKKFANREKLLKIYGTKKKWGVMAGLHKNRAKVFYAYAEVTHHRLVKNGIEWVVFLDQNLGEVFSPLNRLFLQLVAVSGSVVALNFVIALIFGRLLVAPIKKLREATKEIAEGNMDYDVTLKTGDEIEELANSFGEMVLKIKDKQTALERSKNGLKKLSDSLEEKVLERTGELRMANEATLNILEDLQQAKEGLERAVDIKSEFTSVVSHELRTPLTAIKEGIAIVLDETAGKINPEQKDFLATAKRNVDRLARLINDVLDFQKLESGRMKFEMQKGDINEVVSEVIKEMTPAAKERKLALIADLDKKIPEIEFDRDGIIQVLTNLVNNAVKFTEEGSIVIATSCDRKNNAVLVSVKDTGRGIKKEDLPRLFKSFEQLEKGKGRKTGGTGLGLAISKGIITRHNGKIWAESEYGKGTNFCFILPITERRSRYA